MGIAPAAAWVAVRGDLDPRIFLLTGAVMFWGGGFDVLYSCQDYDHLCRENLHSVPRWFGVARALIISRLFHVIAFGLLVWMVLAFGLGKIALAGVVLVGLLLIYEHSLVKPNDLSRLNAAFFTMNGFISMGFLFFIAADFLVR
jgi:4-hydroxybenzoate polyprenyltransferase